MQFDWEQLKPRQTLSEQHNSLIREIAETFLNTGGGTPNHEKKVQLGKNRNLLIDLSQFGFIRNIGNRYYPAFPALYYLSPSIRDSYVSILDLLFKAIKALYEKPAGPRGIAYKEIEDQLNALLTGSNPARLRRMIPSDARIPRTTPFLQDFPHLVSVQQYDANTGIVQVVTATDDILDYENVQLAWQRELRDRPRPNFGPVALPKKDEAEEVKEKEEHQTTEPAIVDDPAESLINAQQRTEDSSKASPEQQQTQREGQETAEDSIAINSINDVPTSNDTLGFRPYVEAIGRFLLSQDTEPPLTLSIEGEWGSGKSSFMLQLRKMIEGSPERLLSRLKKAWAPRNDQENGEQPNNRSAKAPKWRRIWQALTSLRPICVTFNPWRHDKEESLWAAFALEFLSQVGSRLPRHRRWLASVKLWFAQYHWKSGWFQFLRATCSWLVVITLYASFLAILVQKPWWARELVHDMSEKLTRSTQEGERPRYLQLIDSARSKSQEPQISKEEKPATTDFNPLIGYLLGVGGNIAYVALILTVWSKVKDFVGNPVEINLRKYLQDPKYEDRVTFIEQFHKHFKKIVDAYAGKQKVFVFIDDLDRCEIPKAAELMTAVNLLIADELRLIFVLAMDREKVAVGLAVKYEKLFPYLTSVGESELNDSQTKRRIGLEFGQKFLQKFIQLPFRVPQPNPDEDEDFIRAISSKESSDQESNRAATSKADKGVEQAVIQQPQTEVTGGESYAPKSGQSSPSVETIKVRRKRELQFGGDSETVRAVASMFAQTLGRNPRRAIQFLNLFRLQAYIANELGLFDTYQSAEGKQMPLTLEQLGKFVAISLSWPALLDDFAKDSALLARLEEFATENENPGSNPTKLESKWLNEQQLLRLLNYKIEPRSQWGFLLSDFTVSNRTIYRLLHICPQRVQLPPQIDNPSVS